MSSEVLSLREQEMAQRQSDFWSVWSSDYVRNLPPAYQKFQKYGQINVGSVVLIREDNLPRMKWVLGVVQKLHVGKDGLPRAADLVTRQGHRTRAIQRLYNLEIRADRDDVVDVSAPTVDECDKDGILVERRSNRSKKLPKKLEDYHL